MFGYARVWIAIIAALGVGMAAAWTKNFKVPAANVAQTMLFDGNSAQVLLTVGSRDAANGSDVARYGFLHVQDPDTGDVFAKCALEGAWDLTSVAAQGSRAYVGGTGCPPNAARCAPALQAYVAWPFWFACDRYSTETWFGSPDASSSVTALAADPSNDDLLVVAGTTNSRTSFDGHPMQGLDVPPLSSTGFVTWFDVAASGPRACTVFLQPPVPESATQYIVLPVAIAFNATAAWIAGDVVLGNSPFSSYAIFVAALPLPCHYNSSATSSSGGGASVVRVRMVRPAQGQWGAVPRSLMVLGTTARVVTTFRDPPFRPQTKPVLVRIGPQPGDVSLFDPLTDSAWLSVEPVDAAWSDTTSDGTTTGQYAVRILATVAPRIYPLRENTFQSFATGAIGYLRASNDIALIHLNLNTSSSLGLVRDEHTHTGSGSGDGDGDGQVWLESLRVYGGWGADSAASLAVINEHHVAVVAVTNRLWNTTTFESASFDDRYVVSTTEPCMAAAPGTFNVAIAPGVVPFSCVGGSDCYSMFRAVCGAGTYCDGTHVFRCVGQNLTCPAGLQTPPSCAFSNITTALECDTGTLTCECVDPTASTSSIIAWLWPTLGLAILGLVCIVAMCNCRRCQRNQEPAYRTFN